jgi:serine/threonine-protein kinase
LDINPPDIRVRDFGSMNGTYVNGQKIGQRDKEMSPEQGCDMVFPEHDLKNGDELRVGDTVFRVAVHVPTRCVDCLREVPEDKRLHSERFPGVFVCDSCWQNVEQAERREPPKKKPQVCAKCGQNVAAEIGQGREGEFICAQCRQHPLQILKEILDKAKAGGRELRPIEGYHIERELGRGGMGAVYLARHEASGDRVALKVMLPKVAMEERAKAAFLREASNMKALKHQNIVEFYESGCSDGLFFFTIEYCREGNVSQLMEQQGGSLPLDEAVTIICDVLDGLDYAHHAPVPYLELKNGRFTEGHGFVHRDLSPHNILLTEVDGKRVAKIADYGLGKAFDAAGLSGHTRTGSTAGKPWFMPRQQVVNFKYARPEVDVWAAAACLYAMLTAAAPRDFPQNKDVWQVVLETDPVPIRQRDPGIPKRMAKVIDSALVDRPRIRFKTAVDLKKELLAAL